MSVCTRGRYGLPCYGYAMMTLQRVIWVKPERFKKYKNVFFLARDIKQSRTIHQSLPGVLGFLEVSQLEKPWDRVGLDILRPFPTSARGNYYIIVAVDYVTKWVEAGAIPIAGAAEVAEVFVLEVLLRHGAPKKLTTDQGKCFVAKMMNKITDMLKTNNGGSTTRPRRHITLRQMARWNA